MERKNLLIALSVVALLVAIVGLTVFFQKESLKKLSESTKKARGTTNSATLSSQADWEVGTIDNVDTSTVPGDLKIDDLTMVVQNLSGATVTASPDTNKDKPLDGDHCLTGYWAPAAENDYWQIDFGHNTGGSIKAYGGSVVSLTYQYSSDGVSWTDFSEDFAFPPDCAQYVFTNAANFRYVRIIQIGPIDPMGPALWEFELDAVSATHTSGATQITDANFWQWQTFSPTYTEPANTDISFKFRTSADGTTWNSWTASQTVASGGSLDLKPLVASWSGTEESPGTFYKYIQVETTMTNTDGASTPTLSDYSIGYHTNVAPGTPTALTAVVGE